MCIESFQDTVLFDVANALKNSTVHKVLKEARLLNTNIDFLMDSQQEKKKP